MVITDRKLFVDLGVGDRFTFDGTRRIYVKESYDTRCESGVFYNSRNVENWNPVHFNLYTTVDVVEYENEDKTKMLATKSDRQYIGRSDYSYLLLEGMCNGTLTNKPVQFGKNGAYNAYVVLENADIGDHYKLVCEFTDWIRIYDDETLVKEYFADKIKIYRSGLCGCVIQLIGKR